MKYSEIQSEICEKQQLLAQTDYIDNKMLEALVSGSAEKLEEIKQKYAVTLVDREEWRNRISELREMTPEPDDQPIATEDVNEG